MNNTKFFSENFFFLKIYRICESSKKPKKINYSQCLPKIKVDENQGLIPNSFYFVYCFSQDNLTENLKQTLRKRVPDDTRASSLRPKNNQRISIIVMISYIGNMDLDQILEISHTGREADSEHYMACVHHSGDDWIQYDDEKTTERKIEHILELKGGGDWDMGYYYLLYRKLEIE